MRFDRERYPDSTQRSFATLRVIRLSSAFRARLQNNFANFSKPLASKRAFATSMMDIKNSIQLGTADTLVAPYRDCSNQRRSLLRVNVTRFGAPLLARHGQDLSDLGTKAEGEEQPRQRQSQHRPQTDDPEIGGYSPAEWDQELNLMPSYGSHCDHLSRFRGKNRPKLPGDGEMRFKDALIFCQGSLDF
jgi:hypothetical protein